MASSWNRHCANCIGALSFPIRHRNMLLSPAVGGGINIGVNLSK